MNTENNDNICIIHPENEITHICLLKNCYKFLCIKCIPTHLTHHGSKKECPILEEFHLIKSKSLNSLQILLNNFQKTSKNIERFINEDPNLSNLSEKLDGFKSEHVLLIDNLRTLIIKMIDTHFEKIKRDFNEMKKKQILVLKEKKKEFESIYIEIQELYQKINDNDKNVCQNIQNFLSSNIEENFINSSLNIEEYLTMRKSYNILKVDENKINEIRDSIKNCLFLQEMTIIDENQLKIHQPDYYERECKRNYLHYFEEQTKNIYLLNIEDYSNHLKNFSAIELDINFEIPDYHRSISTPNGDIYLIGGEMTSLEDKPTINLVYLYDFIKKTLNSKSSMINERNSFGIVYLNEYIYVFGGFDKNDNAMKKCERYSIKIDEWFCISDIKEGVIDCCVTTFNKDYIYLFGGLKENNQIYNEIIKYDVENDQWNQINFIYEDEVQQQMNLSRKALFPYLAACCQINEEELLIFGGKDYNFDFTSQMLVLDIKENISIKIIDKKMLNIAGSFSFYPIINNNQILCLQNCIDENDRSYISYKKRIIKIDENQCSID